MRQNKDFNTGDWEIFSAFKKKVYIYNVRTNTDVKKQGFKYWHCEKISRFSQLKISLVKYWIKCILD